MAPPGSTSVVSFARRTPVATACYAAVLVIAALWFALQPARVQTGVLAGSSSDVWHLGRDPWIVLPASALWIVEDPVYWIAAVVWSVGVLERRRGMRLAVGVGISAHVLGTALSEGLVWARVADGDLPMSARHLLDVGPSYVVVGCGFAVLCDRAAPALTRWLSAAVLAPILATTVMGLPTGDVSAVGHLVAVAVGVVVGRTVGRGERDEPVVVGRGCGGGSVSA